MYSKKIEQNFSCGCWIDVDTADQVTQSCIYHKEGKLLMRSDVKKDFSIKNKTMDFSKTLYKK